MRIVTDEKLLDSWFWSLVSLKYLLLTVENAARKVFKCLTNSETVVRTGHSALCGGDDAGARSACIWCVFVVLILLFLQELLTHLKTV